jgi:MoaA/NifB/PqqE/SkfB family radical SAM enzyme
MVVEPYLRYLYTLIREFVEEGYTGMDTQDNALETPYLRNIGLVVTYQCQVTCPHCILQAGPHRKEKVDLAVALQWIDQVAEYQNGLVWIIALTGGEPFYNLPVLQELVARATQRNLMVTAVTNAFWASTLERAVKILKSLPGLRLLQISTDIYHLEAIPFERVVNAFTAAQTCGIPFSIGICTQNENEAGYLELKKRLATLVDPDLIYTAITLPVGRAVETLDRDKYFTSQEPPVSACSAGGSPIIMPDGRVLACVGPIINLPGNHPLMLGNLREESLETILNRAQTNPILHAIRVWGPARLIRMADQAGLASYLPKIYYGNSVCNACYEMLCAPELIEFFQKLAKDTNFQREVAYGRVYYLHEPEMAIDLGLVAVPR